MSRVKILVIIIAATSFLACKKSADESVAEKFFSENVLGRDFVITHAYDEDTDLTSRYSGYIFVLRKGADFYGGTLIAKKGSITYQGTWATNEQFGKLDILLPASPLEFGFLTRSWRFTSKSLPILKFAPWGSDARIQLTMERQ